MKAISHTDKTFLFSDQSVENTYQPLKVNLKNGKYVCQLRSIKRVLMSQSVNNDINICLFQHIFVVGI